MLILTLYNIKVNKKRELQQAQAKKASGDVKISAEKKQTGIAHAMPVSEICNFIRFLVHWFVLF